MLTLTDKGLFCEAGGFYVDPLRKVDLALTTHAHSDHARRGSSRYLCVDRGARLLRHRIGDGAPIDTVPYGKKLKLGSVWVSFHPAGHILGSAQIRIEQGSKVWVASGDYKREPDPTCEPFEVVECDTFITEATFGSPKYKWGDQSRCAHEIHEWWLKNAERGVNSLLFCYALGKTQRVLAGLAGLTNEPVHLYGEAVPLTKHYRDEGVRMVPTVDLDSLARGSRPNGALIVAPHSIYSSPWIKKLGTFETGFASGWMQTGAWGARSRYDKGFVLSDHADWPALIETIRQTKARRVLVLHAGEGALTRHLRKLGVQAEALEAPSSKRAKAAATKSDAQGDLFAT